MELNEKTLSVLHCDISARPKSSAGIDQLSQHILSVRVHGNKCIAEFDSFGKSDVHSFVEAEQKCCTTLSWTITEFPEHIQMCVEGTSDQIAVIKSWFEE